MQDDPPQDEPKLEPYYDCYGRDLSKMDLSQFDLREGLWPRELTKIRGFRAELRRQEQFKRGEPIDFDIADAWAEKERRERLGQPEIDGWPILWMFLAFGILFVLAQLVIWFPWLWPV